MQRTSDSVDEYAVESSSSSTTASIDANDTKVGPQHSNLTKVDVIPMNRAGPRTMTAHRKSNETNKSNKTNKDQVPCAPLRAEHHHDAILPSVEAAIELMGEYNDTSTQDHQAVVVGKLQDAATIQRISAETRAASFSSDDSSDSVSSDLPSIEDIERQVQKPVRRIRKLVSRLNNQQMILYQRQAEILQLRMNIVKSMMLFESESKIAKAEIARCRLHLDDEDEGAETEAVIDERLNSSWPLCNLETPDNATLDDHEDEPLSASWPQMPGFRKRGLDTRFSSRTLSSDLSFQMHTIVEELPGEGETSESGSHSKSEQKSASASQTSESGNGSSGEESVVNSLPYIESQNIGVQENRRPATSSHHDFEPESGRLTRWKTELSDKALTLEHKPTTTGVYSNDFWKAVRISDETLDTKVSSLFSEEEDYEGSFSMGAQSEASGF